MDTLNRAQIWKTLSTIDVTPLCTETEMIGKETIHYLPWMAAHEIMMDQFPEYTWEFSEDPQGREVHYFDDGSAEVRCRMTIGTHTNITYLPVHRHGVAIPAPSAMDINTAKQRARVKALGEFGLGYQMWLAKPDTSPELREDAEDKVTEDDLVAQCWLAARDKIADATNVSAGKKHFSRYKKGLENRGLVDPNKNRWKEVCKAKGWRAEK